MADLIDRQQAIDAMCDACSDWCDEGVCKKVSAIQKLPSAQPERQVELDGTESNIEILSELRAQFNCFDEVEEPCYRALSDAICALSAQPERMRFVQQAVNTIMHTARSDSIKDKSFRNAARMIQNAIDGEPQEFEPIPDEPERKKGKWIWWYEESFTEHATEYKPHCKCSECGRECAPSVATFSNFCRNCGADMRGERDEVD